ncbi:hypothetical protein ACFLV7_15895 [Chloroflexota bacterium]
MNLYDDDDDEPIGSWDEQIATRVKLTELEMKKTVDFYIPTEERGTYFPPTQTAYWSTHGPQLTLNSIKATQTTISGNETYQVGLTYDAVYQAQKATLDARATANSKTKTEEAIPKPPVINDIDFPSLIPKTGEFMRGKLYFSDPDGDVTHQNVEVLSYTGSGFTGRTRIITDRLVSGTWYNGAIWIGFLCRENQDVTVRMTLIDWKGNVSNPKTLSFSCR